MSRRDYDDDYYDEDDYYGDDYDDYGEDGRRQAPVKQPAKAPAKPAAPKAPAPKPAPKATPKAATPAGKTVTASASTAAKSTVKVGQGSTAKAEETVPTVAVAQTQTRASLPAKPTKPSIHLIIVGHVDAGKSTMVGHFLHLLGAVSDNTLRKNQRDATNAGKGSFAYAWALDENAEERARGVTMDIAGQHFETESRHIVLLDAPGHRDFIPKMISGAVMADIACLVVDATRGEFESGFESGTTQEHVVLVRSLGVQEIVVCINKMDNVQWDKARYDAVVSKLRPFLEQTGFKKISFIPCSGLSGDNLVEKSSACGWYEGQTLLAVIDACAVPPSSAEGAMRIVVHNFGKNGPSGFSIHGILVSGRLRVGDKILLLPCGESSTCKAIEVHEESQTEAQARQTLSVSLQGNFDTGNLGAIDVACSPDNPIAMTKEIVAQIVSFDLQVPLIPGSKVILHTLGVACEATLRKIRHLQNSRTGEVEQRNPRRLPSKTTAVVELTTDRDVCMEPFKLAKDFGRVTLRVGNHTVAAGIVLATSLN